MNKIALFFLAFLTTAFAHAETFQCVSNAQDIEKINPRLASGSTFWNLDMPKVFEIETEGHNLKKISYRYADLVLEEDMPTDSRFDKSFDFVSKYEDLSLGDKLYKGYVSSKAEENSDTASFQIHSKFQKWGMDAGVNKMWTLTLDKSSLTGKIVGLSKVSLFRSTKLETRFSCVQK